MDSKLAGVQADRNHALFGAILKIDRANRHVHEIESEIRAFKNRNPFGLYCEEEPGSGDLVYKISIKEDVPILLSAPIGDCIHNLRAAFDIVACQIVTLGNGRVSSQTQFPIFSSSKKFRSKVGRNLQGASQAAISVVERLQPYQGEHNQALWAIHRLDILDKHRMIIPVGAAHSALGIDVSKTMSGLMGQKVNFPVVSLRPEDRQFPLKDGAVVFRVRGAARNGMVDDEDHQITIDVAFGEKQIVDGEPVVPTLRQLIQFTSAAVASIADELFS